VLVRLPLLSDEGNSNAEGIHSVHPGSNLATALNTSGIKRQSLKKKERKKKKRSVVRKQGRTLMSVGLAASALGGARPGFDSIFLY